MACAAKAQKASLVRFVRAAGGAVSLDAGGRAAGRGAYVCASATCFETARRRRALDRALRTRIDEASWARLGQEFDKLCAEHSDVHKG